MTATIPSSVDLLRQQYPGTLYLTLEQVAIVLATPTQTIRNQISQGVFPVRSIRRGRRRLVPVAALAAHIEQIEHEQRRGRRRKNSK